KLLDELRGELPDELKVMLRQGELLSERSIVSCCNASSTVTLSSRAELKLSLLDVHQLGELFVTTLNCCRMPWRRVE
ncbi:hypothetical protein KI387_001543, partial [Taxus chinensis]